MLNSMKKFVLFLAAVLLVATGFAKGVVEEFGVKSAVLGVEKNCTVYLPEGYADTDKRYPVLYLLHGAGGCHTDWTQRGYARRIIDETIASGMALPMIVVMPDASGEGEKRIGRNMGYFDVPGWSYERFFFEEFMPAVEKQYRIVGDKKHRAIAGLSMGGGGTAVYAMHHPELFGSACPLSGLLDAFTEARDYDPEFMRSVATTSPVVALRTLSDEQIEPLRSVRWWVDCGDDDFLYECNTAFYQLMRRRSIPLQYRVRDGGHTWRYWELALPDVLSFVSIGFAQ